MTGLVPMRGSVAAAERKRPRRVHLSPGERRVPLSRLGLRANFVPTAVESPAGSTSCATRPAMLVTPCMQLAFRGPALAGDRDLLRDGASLMLNQSTYLYWLIVGCEAAFWVVLLLALGARYLLRRARLSRLLLFALPVVDLLLLAFTALDLRSGTEATFAHGLATAYVGFTLAFGGVVVSWADQRFAHRFAGGAPPVPAPKHGWPALRYELALWLRCIVAWGITVALLIALIAYVGDVSNTQALYTWFRIALGSVVLWFVFGPVWSLVFMRGRDAVK